MLLRPLVQSLSIGLEGRSKLTSFRALAVFRYDVVRDCWVARKP
jgi:hypothetical protein